MDRSTAAILLASMLERLEGAPAGASVSSHERNALRLAIAALEGADEPALMPVAPPVVAAAAAAAATVEASPPAVPPEVVPVPTPAPERRVLLIRKPALPQPPMTPMAVPTQDEVVLNLSSLERSAPSVQAALMCLDFGTAMSKAFVGGAVGQLELELGVAAGRKGHLLPSSMLVGDDGRVYFGHEALEKSEQLSGTRRKRLDSIKSHLSQKRDLMADVDTTALSEEENPLAAVRLTHGDMIRLYLAFFTDVAERALALHPAFADGQARHVVRRYARPCWPDAEQARMADAKMREMMEQAQILADTFSGQWAGGIPAHTLKMAVQKVRELGARPSYLVAHGVPEPVAVAGGVVYDGENARDAYMVVDVGAGTTDFGLFVATRKNDAVKMHQIAPSIHGVMQAGDKVDSLLRAFIAHKEGVDTNDAHGSEVMANLARNIRALKEVLFRTGKLEYTLSDGTVGEVSKAEFLSGDKVQGFARAIEAAFVTALAAVSDSWLQWLSTAPMRLQVVVTGGSAALDMMQALSRGIVDVRGFKIQRVPVDARPDWIASGPVALQAIYPQLAVAIGGTSQDMPDVLDAPGDLKR